MLRNMLVSIDDDSRYMSALPAMVDTSQTWNGWLRPFFPRASVDRIMADFNSEGAQRAYWDGDTAVFAYVPDDPAEHVDRYAPVTVGSSQFWEIGSGSWIWDTTARESDVYGITVSAPGSFGIRDAEFDSDTFGYVYGSGVGRAAAVLAAWDRYTTLRAGEACHA